MASYSRSLSAHRATTRKLPEPQAGSSTRTLRRRARKSSKTAPGSWSRGVALVTFSAGQQQLRHAGLHGRELAAERAQDDGLDQAPDGVAIGVVGAQLGALVRVQAALEEGAEDGRLDERPVEPAHLQERADLRAGERDDVGRVEQAAVEPVDLLGAEEAAVPAHLREQLAERLREDGGAAVGGFREAVEDALRQEAGVLGEQAEQDAVQEVGDLVRIVAPRPQALGDLGEVAGGLLGDLGWLDARPELVGGGEGAAEGLEGFGGVVGGQVVEGDRRRGPGSGS